MKKILIGILSLICCAAMLPLSCYAEETITQDGLVYTRKTSAVDDYWLITGFEETPVDYRVYIPAEIDGIPVDAGFSSFADYIAAKSFEVDPENERLCSVDGVLFSKDMTNLYRYPPLRSGAYTIPDGTVNAGSAFKDCTRLTALTIPDSVTDEIYEFGNCYQLTEINGSFYMSSGYGFRACNKLKSLHIEASDVMGTQTFHTLDCYEWQNLERVVIGNNCELYGDFLIRKCPVLTSIDFSQATARGTHIGANVLVEECASLTEIILPPTTDPDDWANLEISSCEAVETIKIYGNWWVKLSNCPAAAVYGYPENSYLQSYCEMLEVPFIPFGDTTADQNVDIADVLALNKNLLAGEPLSENGRNAADFDGDGTVTSADALCILKHILKM